MTKQREPKMIMHLRWEETSAVDEPANEEPGWAVIKEKERQQMTKEKSPLEQEFEDFLDSLKEAMTGPQYKALMNLLRVLVAPEQDLDNPAGAGQKTRFTPTTENLSKLITDMRALDLDDETCITVIRFLSGNPTYGDYGDSEPGPAGEETSKAVSSTGLGEVVCKVLASAYKQHGRPLVSGLDKIVAGGLDELTEREVKK